MPSSKKIILFGGSFDPIHVGHMKVLRRAIELVEADKAIVIPNFQTPLKDRVLTPATMRLEMLNLAFKNWKNVEISDFEIQRETKCYTIDTLKHFIELNPNAEFYLLLGSDQMLSFKQWKQWDEILKLAQIICFKRNWCCKCCQRLKCNCVAPIDGIDNIIYVTDEPIELSSTQIRKGPVFSYQVNEEVLKYINNHGLYALERIRPLQKESRFKHSLRVGYMARELMKLHKPEWSELAYCAGVYHDISKNEDLNEQVQIAENILGITKYVSPKVLHGYIGAYKLKSKFLFENELILNAIRRHTTPFEYYDTEPNLLDKIVYLADKLEPERTNEDVCGDINYFRELAKKDPNKCFYELYEHTQKAFNNK